MFSCVLHPRKLDRALTLFWKEVVSVLAPREIISMSSLLHCVRDWTKNCDASSDWVWVEYDTRKMFPEIPRHEIRNALTKPHDRVHAKRSTRGPINFFLEPRC